jgi:hypothetical protein
MNTTADRYPGAITSIRSMVLSGMSEGKSSSTTTQKFAELPLPVSRSIVTCESTGNLALTSVALVDPADA